MLVPSSIPLIWQLLKWDIYYLPFFCRSTGVHLKSWEPSLMPPTAMDTYATTCYENTHMEVKRLFYPSNINSIFVGSSLHGSDDTPSDPNSELEAHHLPIGNLSNLEDFYPHSLTPKMMSPTDTYSMGHEVRCRLFGASKLFTYFQHS